MTVDIRSRMREANPLVREEQLDDWFGDDATGRHLREVLARTEGRMTESQLEAEVPSATEKAVVRRKRRNTWLAGAVAAAAVVAVVVGIVTLSPDPEAETPAATNITALDSEPETETAPATTITAVDSDPEAEKAAAVAIAEEFMDARASHDGDAVAALFASDATIADYSASAPDDYAALIEFESVNGFEYTGVLCIGSTDEPGDVRCAYTYNSTWAVALDQGPYPGNRFDFEIEDGQIVWLVHSFRTDEFFPEVRNPLWDWLIRNYPEDADQMLNGFNEFPHTDPRAIELWREHTAEFLALKGADPAN